MLYDFSEKKVYIIDDETGILEIMSDLIKSKLQINIASFSSPMKALESLKNEESPNLFIVDIKMPKMSGIDFIKELRKMSIYKPIIVISGHSDKTHAVECLKLGAYHLLDKPIDFDIFLHTFYQALIFEEIRSTNEKLVKEKEYLLHLFKKHVEISENRYMQIENLLLNKTQIIQNDKMAQKDFLEKIKECNKLDKEISKIYKNIQNINKQHHRTMDIGNKLIKM